MYGVYICIYIPDDLIRIMSCYSHVRAQQTTLLHLSFWGLSLLGSFITCVNCFETQFHLSNVFLLGLPFPQFFLVKQTYKKKLPWFCLFEKMPFSHSLSYRDSLLGHLSLCSFCIDCTQISFWIWNVLCLLCPSVCVVAATSALWSHCKKNVLPFLLSPFGLWCRKVLLSNVSSRLSH